MKTNNIILLGDCHSFKTSYMKYLLDKYEPNKRYENTIGINMSSIKINNDLKFNIYDTSGKENHKKYIETYCEISNIAIFFINSINIIDNIQKYDLINSWIDLYLSNNKDGKYFIFHINNNDNKNRTIDLTKLYDKGSSYVKLYEINIKNFKEQRQNKNNIIKITNKIFMYIRDNINSTNNIDDINKTYNYVNEDNNNNYYNFFNKILKCNIL